VSGTRAAGIVAAGLLAAALFTLPRWGGQYVTSIGVNVVSLGVLALLWGLFCGPTRMISLASAAFFGIGAYATAVLGEAQGIGVAAAVGFGAGTVVALLVGLATLRLSGIYFVIFTYGLSEMVRQLVIWYEVKHSSTVGRYVFTDLPQTSLYLVLCGLLIAVAAGAAWLERSRWGYALRLIGEDEEVARHVGIPTVRVKLTVFVLASGVMSLTGALMAPRWTYIDPSIAFNPIIAFEVVIMALLGGVGRWFGPLLGVVPLALLFEWLSATFPNGFTLLLGLCFLVAVYFVPGGVLAVPVRVQRALAMRRIAQPDAAAQRR
jgi:branched-chain amino acid transport system permease protein